MSRKQTEATAAGRRRYTEEFRREAVQMLLDGHSSGEHEKKSVSVQFL